MGWWFGRKSAPADVRPFVPAWLNTDSAEVGFASSYSEQFEEVYRRNPVGQRAVRLVAGMLGGLTIDVVEGDARAAELVQADGLLEGIAANLLLNGNAYVQLLADDGDRPAELCQLRPERVSVISDERGWPVGNLYRAAGQTVRVNRLVALERPQVAHIKALHPRDDHYGMGCIEAAIEHDAGVRAVRNDIQTATYWPDGAILRLFGNRAVPIPTCAATSALIMCSSGSIRTQFERGHICASWPLRSRSRRRCWQRQQSLATIRVTSASRPAA
jgi:hypothetical protein